MQFASQAQSVCRGFRKISGIDMRNGNRARCVTVKLETVNKRRQLKQSHVCADVHDQIETLMGGSPSLLVLHISHPSLLDLHLYVLLLD